MNALINDKNEVELINIKFQNFKLFSPIFEKMKLYADDEELIKVFNYLFNSIYVSYFFKYLAYLLKRFHNFF